MTGPATPGEEAAEFDRMFALEDGTSPAPSQAAQEQQQPDNGTPAPAAAAEAGKEQGAQGAPADGSGEGGGQSAEQAGGATDADEDAKWLAELSEDARNRVLAERAATAKKLKDAEDRYQALHGRLAPTQQALADAQRRLAQTPAQPQVPAQSTAPVQAPNQTADEFFESPEWKQWASDFPGDAKVIRLQYEAQQRASQQALKAMEDRLNAIAQRLEQTEQVASRTVINDEVARLEARHPDWREVNDSPEFWEWFDSFRSTQPKSLRAQYYDDARLKEMFSDADFTSAMIDGYKATKAESATPAAAAPATPAAAPNSTQTPAPEQRNPRLSMSVAPEVRGGSAVPAAVKLDDLSEAEQFEHVWNNTA